MEVYVDNAATTKMSAKAIEAMLPYLGGDYGNPSSLHSPGQRAMEALASARQTMAGYLGCTPRELIFTSGGSEGDNQALRSAASLGAKAGKRHIISTRFEHHAILHTLKKLEQEGYSVTLLEVSADGLVTAEQVEAALREDTCLVSVMYANNEIGTIQPIEEIGEVCRRRGVLFHTDAVQAAGHLPIDVNGQNIDLLTLSAHKFHGPKGVGALYVRKGVVLTNLIEGGAQERGKRGGTENVAGIVAMATAFAESCESIEADTRHLIPLREQLIQGLCAIPHTALNGHPQKRLPGTVNVCFEGIEGEALLLLLDQEGIYASTGSACASGSLEPSHVLLALGRPHEVAHGSLRLSLCGKNTQEDVNYLLHCIPPVVDKLRRMSPAWRDLCEGKQAFLLK